MARTPTVHDLRRRLLELERRVAFLEGMVRVRLKEEADAREGKL